MIIRRQIEKELKNLMLDYPVVTITGPRQSGKTTLAKIAFPDYTYCNLEIPDIRQLAQNDPHAFFNRFQCPIIIDEIQRVPELLSYIQGIVDTKQQNGLFLLTGSQQLQLNESVSQSLAGRTAMLTLLPFSISELGESGIKLSKEDYLYKGFFPRIYSQNQNPTKALRNYIQTYVERDLKLLLQIKNLNYFENFLKLLAGRVGQVINLNSLSNDVGVSSTTLKHWISILEASHIIYKLFPYFENFGKRVIKSPKIYFTDVGMVCYLLGIENPNQVNRDPLIGNIFENMVVLEAVKIRLNKGLDPNLFFYRDTNGNEVDLIINKRSKLYPVEIKSSMTFNDRFTKGIKYFQKSTPKANNGYLIYSGDLTYKSEFYEVLNYINTDKIFD